LKFVPPPPSNDFSICSGGVTFSANALEGKGVAVQQRELKLGFQASNFPGVAGGTSASQNSCRRFMHFKFAWWFGGIFDEGSRGEIMIIWAIFGDEWIGMDFDLEELSHFFWSKNFLFFLNFKWFAQWFGESVSLLDSWAPGLCVDSRRLKKGSGW
jgi:hypothetical protein